MFWAHVSSWSARERERERLDILVVANIKFISSHDKIYNKSNQCKFFEEKLKTQNLNFFFFFFRTPRHLPPISHNIEEGYEKPKKRRKKKKKSASADGEPRPLKPLKGSGFKSSAPPSESGRADNQYLDAVYTESQNGHIKIDSDQEDYR